MSLGVPGITLDMMIFMILFSNKKPGKDVPECVGSIGKHLDTCIWRHYNKVPPVLPGRGSMKSQENPNNLESNQCDVVTMRVALHTTGGDVSGFTKCDKISFLSDWGCYCVGKNSFES